MSNINQPGIFRGDILDRGLGVSSGGYPQLMLSLRAAEKYDEQNGVWLPWDCEESEATAYLVLFGKNNKPTLNARQCMTALDWDGASFASLQENKSVTQIQFRMEASEYEDVTRIKVAWIAPYDADPRRSINKLDASDVKKLDAQFAAALKTIGGGPRPKTAAPVAPPVVHEPPKRIHPAKPPAMMDQNTAWEKAYNKGHEAGKSDMEIMNAWVAVVNELGGHEAIGDDWTVAHDKTITALGV